MFRVTFLAFLVVAALTANECDISLGDLDQFVINYRLQVTNFGNEDAAVSISIQDKMRSATLCRATRST